MLHWRNAVADGRPTLVRFRRRTSTVGCFAWLSWRGGRGATAACAAWRGGVCGGGAGACIVALVAWRRRPRRSIGLCAAASIGLCLGTPNAAAQAQLRLDDSSAEEHQNEVARLVLRVAELPDGDARGQRFVGEQVAPARAGMPSRILVSWLSPPDGQ